MKYNDYLMHRHHDDSWIDEIQLVGADGIPALRLVLKYRYKTSGLSGNEWRVSTFWQNAEHLAMRGDSEPDPREAGWYTFDGPYKDMAIGCAALYPGLYTSQPQQHNFMIAETRFLRKGRILYSSSYEGEARPLLTMAGHLPWANVEAGGHPLGTDEAWEDYRNLCHQPGCCEPAVSTYLFKDVVPKHGAKGIIHRFCPLHLRRGDNGIDSDESYEVIEGPGPEAAVGWRKYESRARKIVI